MNSKEILSKLEELRSIDTNYKIFGSEFHKYKLNPVLPEKAILKFETNYKIKLPLDYRSFLMEIGNGGAGPYYGVFPLGEYDEGVWKENDGFVGVLSEFFPYTSDWNEEPNFPNENDYEDEEKFEKDYLAVQEEYWKSLNGAIPICHQGCANRNWLIISGQETGKIWIDKLADFAGLKKTDLTFGQWYLKWLNDSLEKIKK